MTDALLGSICFEIPTWHDDAAGVTYYSINAVATSTSGKQLRFRVAHGEALKLADGDSQGEVLNLRPSPSGSVTSTSSSHAMMRPSRHVAQQLEDT